MHPTPRSLVLDLLSTAPPRPLPVASLLAGGALFGLAENAMRVALSRLCADGLIARDERGQYRLGPAAAAVSSHVTGWRTVESGMRPWTGGWVAVHHGPPSRADRAASRRSERALRFLGFERLAMGLSVRPDNLAGGVDAVRARLGALGLSPQALVCGLTALDAEWSARAMALWDGRTLRSAYRATRSALVRSARRLPTLGTEAAMRESFLLGGRAIRQIVLDPLLPEPIVPAAERRALIDTMREYDRLGRAYWAGFARGHATAQRHTPADVRLAAARHPTVLGGFA